MNPKLIVMTGGSSVYHGRWSACDHPMTRWGRPTETQKAIEDKIGTYLLARGLVNQAFGHIRYKNLLVIQSRKRWDQDPNESMFFASLLGVLTHYHNNNFLIKSPWKPKDKKDKQNIKQKLINIRNSLEIYIEGLSPKIIGYEDGKPITFKIPPKDRVMFTF